MSKILSANSSASELFVYLLWQSEPAQIYPDTSSLFDILHQVKAYRSIETILSEIRQQGGEVFVAGAKFSDEVPVSFLEVHLRGDRLDFKVQFGGADAPFVRYSILRKPLV